MVAETGGRVYALLVGIDNYPDPRHRLSGCLNDVEAFEAFLRQRVTPERLHLRTLRDRKATRESVITTCLQHLGQAKAGATALLFYAGHGSQEAAPEAFWPVEPDHLNETLVLYDSRERGAWDLADKELAALVRKVAADGAHVVVILDCCHSGSGTRAALQEEAVRRFPTDRRVRPLEDYWAEGRQTVIESRGPSGWNTTDAGRHVLMAACRDEEEAKEYSAGATKRGAFSYFLLKGLQSAQGGFTYRDLIRHTQAMLASRVVAQTPQLEATVESDLERPFLGGEVSGRAGVFTVHYERAEGWRIDGGRIHGISPPDGDETTHLAVFPADASAHAMRRAGDALGTARVIAAEAGQSRIAFTRGEPAKDATYRAVVTSLPLSPYRVRLEGEAEALGPVREAIGRSLDVRESTGDADFRLQARNGAFWILRPADDRPLTAEVPGSGPAEAALVVARLEHIARWTRYATLENPSSRIRTSDVDLRLFLDDGQEEVTALEVRLRAKRKKGKLVSPRFRVRVRNAGEQVLYVGILAMDELFSISTDWFPEGVVKLEPGQEVWALGGKAVTASIAPSLREAGAVETRDILKLIACTSDFEVRLAAQGALDAPRRRAAGFDAARPSTLNRLLERGQTRTLSAEPADDEEIQDFLTKAVTITVVEPRERVAISRTDPAELGGQVVIERHPSLLAKARLTTVSESRSDLGNAVLPPLFRDDPMGWEPLRFSTARGSDPGLTVLELSEVQEHTSISDQAPLMVKVPVVLQEGEAILAVGFDGDLYLPLGWSRRHANHTEVRLERLPHPVAQQARSLTGSIRILFQKLVGARLGRPYAYPLLAAAAWDAEGGVSYVRDVDAVRQKVSSAERVVLFVHGIIGDTEGIGARLRLRPGKDVALTFDYENLHTTIEENARGLKQRLDEVGLPQGHAKELVIVAHSMGGLVSRWFIEKEGGKDVVSRLLLCGTPNGGSPWPTVQDWVTSAVAMALNGLTAVAWPAAAVGWLLSGLERLDNSLDQMKPGSALLTELARAPDPKRPYTILAGSTSLAPEAGPRWRQLAQRLFHRALSAAFLFEPNDIAVSVASIGQVDRRRAPAPRVVEVACDHLTYFRAPAGLAALQEALGG